jgi:sodium transport system permease protein
MNILTIVLGKELRESMRDRRTLIMLGVCVVVYPLLLALLLTKQIRSAEPQQTFIEVALHESSAPLSTYLTQHHVKVHTVHDAGELSRSPSAQEGTVGIAKESSDDLTVYYDSTTVKTEAYQRLLGLLRDFNAQQFARAHPEAAQLPQLSEQDISSSALRAGDQIKGFIGMLFMPAFFFCMSTVIDATAGEKERRTAEVLLAQPLSPVSLIAGKWLSASLIGVVGLSAELLLVHGLMLSLPLEQIGMSWTVSTAEIIGLCIASASLPLLAAAVEMVLAINAKTYKEAQTTVGLTAMVPLLISVLAGVMGVAPHIAQALPMLSNHYLLQQLASGAHPGLMQYGSVFLINLLCAAPFLAFAVARISRPGYLANA